MVCLIGASGSGKSTLLRCINLLEPIDDGAIFLDGVDIAEPGLDPQPVRERIGIVFQSYNLFPHMTAAENVMLAPMRVRGRSKVELADPVRLVRTLWLARPHGPLSRPAVRRAAAARGDHSRAGDGAGDHAVR
jgi:ABC-type polar amino acid transport system ATPase subunit